MGWGRSRITCIWTPVTDRPPRHINTYNLIDVLPAVLGPFIFLALCMVVGFGPVSRLDDLPTETQGCLSFVLGTLLTGHIIYQLTVLKGGLSPLLSMSVVCTLALLSLAISRPSRRSYTLPITFSAALFVVLVPLWLLASLANIPRGPEGMYSQQQTWWDIPFHLSLISSFTYGGNIPPVYPFFPSIPVRYPFLIDFISAILVDLGASLRLSLLVPDMVMYACCATLVYSLVRHVLEDDHVASLAPILLCYAGGLQFLYASAYGIRNPLSLSDLGFHIHNTVWAFLLPQRTTVIGICAFSAILLLLGRAVSKRCANRRYELALAGLIAGLLPMYHAHSFLASCVVFAGVALMELRDKRGASDALCFLVPIAILAIPQVMAMSGQFSQQGFIRQSWWWMLDEGTGPLEVAGFWIKNLGFMLILYALGLRGLPRSARVLVLASLPLLIIPNIVILQPKEWDSSKMVVLWLVGSLPVLCEGALRALRKGPIGLILVVPVLASSVLYLGPMFMFDPDNPTLSSPSILFTNDSIAVAEWVRDNTPPDAILLTPPPYKDSYFFNPYSAVTSLAGRRTYMGWYINMEFVGIDYKEALADTERMVKGDCGLLDRYGIDYVYLHPENGPAASVFVQVFNRGGDRVYKVSCP